jgi:hypothetical protein
MTDGSKAGSGGVAGVGAGGSSVLVEALAVASATGAAEPPIPSPGTWKVRLGPDFAFLGCRPQAASAASSSEIEGFRRSTVPVQLTCKRPATMAARVKRKEVGLID